MLNTMTLLLAKTINRWVIGREVYFTGVHNTAFALNQAEEDATPLCCAPDSCLLLHCRRLALIGLFSLEGTTSLRALTVARLLLSLLTEG